MLSETKRLCAALVIVAGCAVEVPASEYPTFEEMDADGAYDSFASPTAHGAIALGASGTAAVDGTHRFHQWSFELATGGSLALELQAPPRTRSELVRVYLYQLQDGRWGRYIAKGTTSGRTTRLEHDATPGLYRVVVATRAPLTGDIELSLECSACRAPARTGIEVAVLDENDLQPYDRYRALLMREHLEVPPARLRVDEGDGGDAEYKHWDELLSDYSERLEDFPAMGGFGDPTEDYVLCYHGDPTRVPGLIQSLTDNVFSDMLYVWGWKTADKTELADEEDADAFEGWLGDEAAEWNRFDGAHGAVAIAWTATDSGDDGNVTIIPRCE